MRAFERDEAHAPLARRRHLTHDEHTEMMPLDFERKLCAPELLRSHLATLPRPLVFTNGCFDILHRGHVTYLAQARALGSSLVVALNSDASARRLGNGDARPTN